jgi:hypothetical protein
MLAQELIKKLREPQLACLSDRSLRGATGILESALVDKLPVMEPSLWLLTKALHPEPPQG